MRSYPWKCGTCGQRAIEPVVVEYSTEMDHDGRSYSLTIPRLELLECKDCHARVLTDTAHERLSEALRAKAGLLTPQEIRKQREMLGLTQKDLAACLKVAEATVARWEAGGQIQQRAMDTLLRLFFDVPQARAYLGGAGINQTPVTQAAV
jgi:putative zinc finger/helix-turn-helix YgiT family protein